MAGVNQLHEMLARANLHDDPLRFVLEYIDGQITRLELVAAREPISQVELDRITRAAAIGANDKAVAMVRSANLRTCWWIAAGWSVSLIMAGLLGYLVR